MRPRDLATHPDVTSPAARALAAALRVPVRRPLATLACLALAAVLGAPALSRGVRTDFGIDQLLPLGDAELQRYRSLGERFGRDDAMIFVFVDDPALITPERAAEAVALSDALAASRYVAEVVGLATATLVAAERDGERGELVRVGPILDRARLGAIDHARLRERLRQDPVYADRVLSRDGRMAAFAVQLAPEYSGDVHRRDVVAHVDQVVARFAAPGRTIHVTGSPHTRVAYVRFLLRDGAIFTGACSLLLALALAATFRSALGVALPLSAVLAALYFTGVIFALSGLPLSLLSSAISVLVLITGISDAIHLLERYGEELALGREKQDALERAVGATAHACLLTSITTSAGFFLLPTTGIPMLGDTGLIVGAGVLVAYVVTLTLLPALASLLPAPRPRPPASEAAPLARLARVVMSRPRTVIAACLGAIALVCAAGVPRLRVDSRVVDDLPDDHPLLVTRAAVEAHMGGNFPLLFVVHPAPGAPGVAGAAEDPALLAAVADFQRALAAEGGDVLARTLSASDLLGMTWRELGGDGALPPTRAAVAQTVLVLGEDALRDAWDPAHESLLVEVRVHDRGTRATFAFIERARAAFARTVGERGRLEVQGFTYLAQRVHRDVVGSTMTGFGLDFALVAALVWLLFRSWRLMLLAIVPNLLPLACTTGFMGLAGIDLRISSSIVFCVVFGVAVDDTVHFLARYHEERGAGLGPADAVARTMATTGRAMVSMALVLACGFAVLCLSEFTPNRVLGLLMAVTVASGLVGDLVLLPALLVVGDRARGATA